jgi:two-component system phosphate regulon response regulator PhoB
MSNKVLVVDDEPDLVELLSCHLKFGGYEVLRAANGLEALHQARRHLPDVILLDLMLDGMDGYSVCEILRAQPSTARIPVILVTALGGEIARLNGLESGADDFVRKPFVREEILRRVEAALERVAVRVQAEALAADPALPGVRPG